MSESQSPSGDAVPAFTVLPAGTAPPATIPSTSPATSGGGPALNPRSCVTCRRRKVRCDKLMPCSNCRRAHIQCVFPAPGRAPRRPRARDVDAPTRNSTEREAELLKRLRKLEGIVEELSGQVEVERQLSADSPGADDARSERTERTERADRAEKMESIVTGSVSSPSGGKESPLATTISSAPRSASGDDLVTRQKEVYRQFGRLVVTSKGKDRYISSAFWSKVNDELDDIRSGVHSLSDNTDYSDHEDNAPAPEVVDNDHNAFILGYKSSSVDLASFHPPPVQIPYLWQKYCENIEPILKIMHVPTMAKLMKDVRDGTRTLSASEEALVFSIYFASITTLEEDDVKPTFGLPQGPLLQRYRFALEQALAKANFIKNPDMIVLTALILFLIVVRRHDDSRFCWTMTSVAIRLAQGLGLHRDGTHLKLSPFDTEMRRRLWWTLCTLDLRCAEEMGTDLGIYEQTFDTKFPSNINDADILPDSTEFPLPLDGPSEIALPLVRFEICAVSRKLVALATAGGPACPRDAILTMEERERKLVTVYDRVESKFLRTRIGYGSKEKDPLHGIAALVARIIMAKMSLVIYQPMLFPGKDHELSAEIKERLFVSAVEIVEYNYQLNRIEEFKRFRWLFQTYTQWQAIAYLLLEMARRPWTPTLERAWEDLNGTLRSLPLVDFSKITSHLAVWLPLRKLLLKAGRHRTAEIARLKADPEAARLLEMRDPTNPQFASTPSSHTEMQALQERRERWLALIRPDDSGPRQPRPATNPPPNQGQRQPQQHMPPTPAHQAPEHGPTPPHQAHTQTQAQIEAMRPSMRVSGQDMEYFNELLGNPFNPIDFYSAMSSSEATQEAALHYMYEGQGSAGSSKSPVAGTVRQPQPVQSSAAAAAPRPSAGEIALRQQAVHLEATRKDGQQWLWSDPFTVLNSKMETEGGDAVSLGDAENMDLDEFNWQTWSESMKGLELGGSTWNP